MYIYNISADHEFASINPHAIEMALERLGFQHIEVSMDGEAG